MRREREMAARPMNHRRLGRLVAQERSCDCHLSSVTYQMRRLCKTHRQ
jgi:hypothetical protein